MSLLLSTGVETLRFVIYIIAGLVGMGVIFAGIARLSLFIRYNSLNKAETQQGLTALTATRALLDANGMQDVEVKQCGFWRAWFWGNSYSTRKKTIYLRKGIINKKSITAIGVGLQKTGLAIMHKRGDKKLNARSILLPLSYIMPTLFIPIVIIGLLLDIFLFNFTGTATIVSAIIGFAFYLVAFVYMLINIPVEKQANRLAMGIIEKSNFMTEDEREKVNKLFKSYILMYVVDFVVALLNVILQILKVVLKVVEHNN